MEYVVEALSLSKRYGDVVAVDRLELAVAEGEIYGLIGPNGAGKTTLVKMLVGILRPDRGEARVLGKPTTDKDVKASIGYMPQERAIYQDLTVEENIAFFGRIMGVPRSRLDEQVSRAIELVGLEEKRKTVAMELSGGMQHRLSLACSVVHDPSLLFLDEPTVGVDPELRATFWLYFSRLAQEGKTILITTHYMAEASECMRVGMMRRGRLIAQGEPGELARKVGATDLEDAFLRYSEGLEEGSR